MRIIDQIKVKFPVLKQFWYFMSMIMKVWWSQSFLRNKCSQIKFIVSLLPINLMSHDVVEIIACDKPVIIQISFGKIMLNFIVCQSLSKILSDFFKLQGGDSALKLKIQLQLCLYQMKWIFFQFRPCCLCLRSWLWRVSGIQGNRYLLIDHHQAQPGFGRQTCFGHQNQDWQRHF